MQGCQARCNCQASPPIRLMISPSSLHLEGRESFFQMPVGPTIRCNRSSCCRVRVNMAFGASHPCQICPADPTFAVDFVVKWPKSRRIQGTDLIPGSQAL